MPWSSDHHRQSAEEAIARGIMKGDPDVLAEVPEPTQSAEHQARVNSLTLLNFLAGTEQVVPDEYQWRPEGEQPPEPPPEPPEPEPDPEGPNPENYDNVVIVPAGVHRRFGLQVQANTLYLGDGAILDGENAVNYAFYGTAQNVGIQGFEIRNYTNPDQRGAIDTTGAQFWFVYGCNIHDNRGAGVALDGDFHIVRANHIHHQGQIGIKIRDGVGSRVEDNRFIDNNQRRVNWGWEGGGSKFARNRNLTIARNFWTEDFGPGCWVDIDNHDVTIVGNTSENCHAAGIFYEINGPAVIKDNVIRNCGHGRTGWVWGAGLEIATSYGVHVEGNVVEDCRNGIVATYQPRGGSRDMEDITVVGNTVRNSGVTGATDNQNWGPGNQRYQTIDFAHNQYEGGSFAWANGRGDVGWWRGIHPEDAV